MGSTGPTTTTTANKDPWGPSQPYLGDIMGQSKQLYDSGAGSQTWGGPTVAPINPITNAAMSGTLGLAQQQMGTAGAPYAAALQGVQNGGVTPAMLGPLHTLSGVASGQTDINTGGVYGGLLDRSLGQNNGANGVLGSIAGGNPVTTAGAYGDAANRAQGLNSDVVGGIGGLFNPGQNSDAQGALGGVVNGPGIGTGADYRAVANAAAAPSASQQYLSQMAQGGGSNPYLDKMITDQDARISNRVNSAMSGTGRYGSVGHADALARSIGAADNPLLAQAYDSDRNRMLQASGQIDASRVANGNLQLGALGGATGVEGQNIANRMSAASGLAGMRNADTSLGAGLLGQMAGIRSGDFGGELSALGGMTGAQGQNANARLAAASGLGESNRADLSGAMNALGGMTGVQGQNIGNQMGAANGLLGAYNTAQNQAQNWAQMAPGLGQAAYNPLSQIGNVGNYLGARSQQELDAQRQLFEQRNAMPWTQLGRYENGINGLSGILQGMGTTNGTSQTRTPLNPLSLAPLAMLFPWGRMGPTSQNDGVYPE